MFSKWKKYQNIVTGEMTWPPRTQVAILIGGFFGFVVVCATLGAMGVTSREGTAFFLGFVAGIATMIWDRRSREAREIERKVYEKSRQWNEEKLNK